MIGKEQSYTEFRERWRGCQGCPLSSLRTQVVFGQGNLDASLVMIGEAPNEQEDRFGKPSVGPAGENFNKLLAAVGLARESLWITNTCLCRPKVDKPGKSNRAPNVKEIQACFPRLYEELNIIKPKIIVLAGNTPLYLATQKRGIMKNRGWQTDAKWVGDDFIAEHVFATLHPASLLYGTTEAIKEKKKAIFEDWLAIAARMLNVTKTPKGI